MSEKVSTVTTVDRKVISAGGDGVYLITLKRRRFIQ